MENILAEGKLKVSSNDAMSNSLTDGSTETFWESRDEGRGKARSVTVSYDKPAKVFAACIHIDNQKDSGVRSNSIKRMYTGIHLYLFIQQRVEQLTLLAGADEDSLKETEKVLCICTCIL